MAGGPGQQTPRQQQRTGERLQPTPMHPSQLSIPELLVETGVVRQQGALADEVRHLRHHLSGWRGAAQHGVADTSKLLDKGRHPGAAVHQTLVARDDLPTLDYDHTDLGGTGLLRR